MKALKITIFVAVFLLISHLDGQLHAYLDPGTGSMVLQVILGGIVGTLTLARVYWRRIKTYVLRRPSDDQRP